MVLLGLRRLYPNPKPYSPNPKPKPSKGRKLLVLERPKAPCRLPSSAMDGRPKLLLGIWEFILPQTNMEIHIAPL